MSDFALDRRRVLGMGAAFMMAGVQRAAAAAGDLAARLSELQRDGRIVGLHTLLVSRGGKLLFEHYGTGEDENWGTPLGTITFGPTVLHDLRSVTKSIVGMLYGIALAHGKVPEPQAKLYDQFPEYADLARQPGRERITVAHVLSMSLGTEWDELTIPYGDPRNSEVAMELSPDRYRYVLERPIVDEPGIKWTYNGGATALLGRLITKGTGEKLPDYARHVLFDPLGLGPTEWSNGLQGEAAAASGLRMRAPDLVRIGQMVLMDGTWQGKEIVPKAWLQQSTTPSVPIEGNFRYGWHWYLGELAIGAPSRTERLISGVGWGGQRLFLVPALDLVVAINAGNYRKPGVEQRRVANVVLTELILPNIS
ncbi:MAG TPA: serine hydrolase [Hyphomicrobiaceae bacterium]|nr:serine hydrolase [Hyphomicrobiaceae bacterium]